MNDPVVYTVNLIYACLLSPLLNIVASVVLIAASKQISKLSGNKMLISVCKIFGIAFLFYSLIGAFFSIRTFFEVMIFPLLSN